MNLCVKGLKKSYIRGTGSFCAVNDVDFSINSGELIHIIGKSGSGKSTFLNLIAGLLTPDSGSIHFDNMDYDSLDDNQLSLFRNKQIGYIPQGYGLLSGLDVVNNVILPSYLYKREGEPVKKAYELLERLGISALADSFPKNLSGGELKRVMIARALLNEPELILADEPTGDLDAENTLQIMKIFTDIAAHGIAVVMVTHDFDILKYGHKTYEMRCGRLSPKGNE